MQLFFKTTNCKIQCSSLTVTFTGKLNNLGISQIVRIVKLYITLFDVFLIPRTVELNLNTNDAISNMLSAPSHRKYNKPKHIVK